MLQIIDVNSNFLRAKQSHISHSFRIIKRSIDMFIQNLNIL